MWEVYKFFGNNRKVPMVTDKSVVTGEMRTFYAFTSGQSLVEVVVVIGVVVLLVFGLVILSLYSLKSSRVSSNKSPASKFAQEGIEIARNKRNSSWNTFLQLKDQANGVYCLDVHGQFIPAYTSGTIADCTDNLGTYSRSVTFEWDGIKMKVTSMVSWNNGGQNQQSSTKLVTYFTEWK